MKTLFLFVTLLIFFSCNADTKSATAYNNTLLLEQQSIANKVETYLKLLKDTSNVNIFESEKNSLLNEIDLSLSTLNKIEDFEGNTSFRNSIINVLTIYAEGVKIEYEAIADYQRLPFSEKNEINKTKAEQLATFADQKISNAEDKFILEQQKFALENDFKLD